MKTRLDVELTKLLTKNAIDKDKGLEDLSKKHSIKKNILKQRLTELKKETKFKKEIEETPKVQYSEAEVKEAIKKLKSPKVILAIHRELDIDHKIDHKDKCFIFFGVVSGLLKKEYRISVAIKGDSAVGKDNAVLTAYKHIPDGKMLVLTRITGASLEDDIKQFPIIYIGEGNFQREDGSNKAIIEYIKSLAESGIEVWKKDTREGRKGETRKEKQERKTIIYSSTDTDKDEELSTRFALASILGYPSKTRAVNINTLEKASDFKKELKDIEREKTASWIKIGLSNLEDFDIITIPYASLLEINSKDPRSQRDLKRFLNLIRTIAWICQKQRLSFEYKDKKILVCAPEDFYNALQIGEEIFAQSLSGREKRIEDTLKAIEELKDKEITVEGLGGLWICKIDLQTYLGIKTRDTINKRLSRLADLGLIFWETRGNNSYVQLRGSASSSAFKERLITVEVSGISEKIDNLYLETLEKLDAEYTLDRRSIERLKKEKTLCLDFRDFSASNKELKDTDPIKKPPKNKGEEHNKDKLNAPKLDAEEIDIEYQKIASEVTQKHKIKTPLEEGENSE